MKNNIQEGIVSFFKMKNNIEEGMILYKVIVSFFAL